MVLGVVAAESEPGFPWLPHEPYQSVAIWRCASTSVIRPAHTALLR
jgi:hypothetical protein